MYPTCTSIRLPIAPFAANQRSVRASGTAEAATTTATDLPFGEEETGQAVLYAERSYVRATDGQSVTVRSNPLLIIIFEGGA